jgi:hypothetical protein
MPNCVSLIILQALRITIEKPYKKTLNKFDKMCKNITAMSHSPKIPSKRWNKSSSVPNDNFSRKFTQICMLRGNHELSTSSVTNKKTYLSTVLDKSGYLISVCSCSAHNTTFSQNLRVNVLKVRLCIFYGMNRRLA